MFAKSFNTLAAGADKAQFGPSPGAIFNSTNGGMAMYIESSRNDDEETTLEQFQIVVDPYIVAGVDTGLSIIRVVKGEVVWSPKLLEVPGIPKPPACTTQITIENWFALPTFPVIDDENAIYIGDGGIRVPKVADIPIGIFIFKATNLPVDVDPIILVAPNYTPTCPVEFPGLPPFPLALWEVVKIGSVVYTEDAWKITQNFIGSMTLPGGGDGSSSTAFLPPQLPSNAIPKARPMPFECRIDVDSSGDMLLRIGNGTVSYTKSDMPWVGIGANVNKFQVRYSQLQVVPSGWRKQGPLGADLGWMELGGGYKITGQGQWYLVACYWDALESAGDGNFTLPTPLKSGVPFLALIDAYGADVDKLFVETGPGLYTNTMNIQRMSGYTSADTGEDWDWGHCHTTYFNPMKLGYDIKIIATIESSPASASIPQILTYQSSTDGRNEIQNIYFPVLPKDGFVVFTFDGLPSSPFYPAPWSGANDATNLFNALQAIPALVGNITVTRTSEKNFYITFINALEATDVPLLGVGVNALQSWDYEYFIDQNHIGNLVLDAGPRFDGTQIMNKPNVTQLEDPYVIQSNNNPAFNKIINRADVMACNNLSGDTNFTAGIIPIVDNGTPRQVARRSWVYGEANGCSGAVCEHPFQVNIDSVEEGTVYYSVCSGTVNNKIPDGIDAAFTMADGDLVWIRCEAEQSGSYEYPKTVTVEHGTTMPVDTNTYGYIKVAKLVGTTIDQYVTGSLWTDRIKLGTNTATYYFARV